MVTLELFWANCDLAFIVFYILCRIVAPEMAEYRSIIEHAVAGLPNNTGAARHTLYERARQALIAQMQSFQPALAQDEIARERSALEDAILDVESTRQALGQARPSELKAKEPPARSTKSGSVVSLPPISVIPEQNEKTAFAFVATQGGPLDLIADPPADPFDVEQNQHYQFIRTLVLRIKQAFPTQQRVQIDSQLDDFLKQPDEWSKVQSKRMLWCCANALRNKLAQHDLLKSDSEPSKAKLPTELAEALSEAIQNWNVFVFGDPDLGAFDFQVGSQDRKEVFRSLEAAKAFLAIALGRRQIVTARAGEAIDLVVRIADLSAQTMHAAQAQDVACATARNLISQVLRQAYLGASSVLDPKFPPGAKTASGLPAVGAIAATRADRSFVAENAWPFVEFVANCSPTITAFLAVSFNNPQLSEIVDAISLAGKTRKP